MNTGASPEEWRPIPGFEGLYDASSLGRIRSHHRGGRIKEPSLTRDGYLLAFLHSPNGRKGHNVHRLVCMAFNGLPSKPGMDAAHRDGNRTNNVPNNLVWTTHAENLSHKGAHGTVLRGEAMSQARLTEAWVKEIWSSSEGRHSLARRFGVSIHAIDDVRYRKRWNHITKDLPPQPSRTAKLGQFTPPSSEFAEAAKLRPHWSALAAQFGMSKAAVYRNLAKLRACTPGNADAPNPLSEDH